jgi:hypothetical protein
MYVGLFSSSIDLLLQNHTIFSVYTSKQLPHHQRTGKPSEKVRLREFHSSLRDEMNICSVPGEQQVCNKGVLWGCIVKYVPISVLNQ